MNWKEEFVLSKIQKVGGQAVIEGVLMMGKRVSVAVRDSSGGITVTNLGSVKIPKYSKVPFVRGIVSLFYSLYFGIKALNLSAEVSSGEKMKKSENFWTLVSAFAFAIGLFVIAPAYLTKFLGFKNNEFLFSFVDGIIRLSFFLAYVWIISLFKDVKRVFQYHGAEHKTINTYESGEELTVENAKKHSRIHMRCGTNFVMIFMIIAIIVFSIFGIFWKMTMFQRILIRIFVMPLIAGISYEFLKLFDRFKSLKFIAYPGLVLQLLTTAEPDDSQLEVAITALNSALENLEGENNTANEEKDENFEPLG